MRTLTLLLAASVTLPGALLGCFAGAGGGGTTPGDKPQPAAAPLETHVRVYRAQIATYAGAAYQLGKLPADLSVPDLSDRRFNTGAASAGLTAAPITGLTFDGVTGDRICFGDLQVLDKYDTTPAAELLAAKQRQLATEGAWVMAVPSLAALTGPAWPAPAGAATLSTVEITDDKEMTTTSQQQYGDGTIDVKKTDRNVFYTMCATGFQAAPDSHYLIAVTHNERGPDDYERTAYDSDTQDTKDQVEIQHDALLVWTLSDDGSADLSR